VALFQLGVPLQGFSSTRVLLNKGSPQQGFSSTRVLLNKGSPQQGFSSTGRDEDRVENAYHQLTLIVGLIPFLWIQRFASVTASRRDSHL
jgi:hypothetical protein